jgi:hypothetical protein
MYLVRTVRGESLLGDATARKPFGPEFTKDQATAADRMEVWGSSFSDPGDDFCDFKLFSGTEEIAVARVGGY